MQNPHIKKILYKSSYIINEAASIRKLTEAEFENDDMPEDVIPLSNTQTTNNNQATDATKDSEPKPESNQAPAEEPQLTNNVQKPQEQQNSGSVDSLQNDLIRMNLNAMVKIHNELDSLNKTVQNLNIENQKLKSQVEEVREPSTEEKLLKRKQDSYPYYNNLSDVWKDNWFEKKTVGNEYNGITKLDDGTYIANFDDLPKTNNIKGTF